MCQKVWSSQPCNQPSSWYIRWNHKDKAIHETNWISRSEPGTENNDRFHWPHLASVPMLMSIEGLALHPAIRICIYDCSPYSVTCTELYLSSSQYILVTSMKYFYHHPSRYIFSPLNSLLLLQSAGMPSRSPIVSPKRILKLSILPSQDCFIPFSPSCRVFG